MTKARGSYRHELSLATHSTACLLSDSAKEFAIEEQSVFNTLFQVLRTPLQGSECSGIVSGIESDGWNSNSPCERGITVSINSDKTLVHHILGAFSPERVCGFLCEQCPSKSNKERPAVRQRTVLSFPRFLKIKITAPVKADGLPTDYHQHGPLLEYETLDLSRFAPLSQRRKAHYTLHAAIMYPSPLDVAAWSNPNLCQ
jgi:hypothetical protein